MPGPSKTPETVMFGGVVAKLRKRAKLSQDKLAARLNVVRSYISHVETGRERCREDFAQRLDNALDTHPKIHNAWIEHIAPLLEAPKFPKEFANFARAESKACEICSYQNYVVHGLLQTPAYARVILPNDEDYEARLQRQNILTSERPPLLSVVLEEGILYRMVGSREVMKEQLEWLIEASLRPRVRLQVIRFAFHENVRGSFNLLTLPDRREFVYTSHAFGGDESRDPTDISTVVASMATLQSEALNAPDTRNFMQEVIDERWT